MNVCYHLSSDEGVQDPSQKKPGCTRGHTHHGVVFVSAAEAVGTLLRAIRDSNPVST